MNRFGLTLILALLVLVVAIGAGAFIKFEGRPPETNFEQAAPEVLGLKNSLKFELSDQGQGLRSVRLSLIQGDREKVVAEQTWPGRYLVLGSYQSRAAIEAAVDPKELGLSDGPAELRLLVRDYSWRESFHGNKRLLNRQVVVDTRPPLINVLSKFHYLNYGGCGLVVYSLSEESRSGVLVGDRSFPGLPAPGASRGVQACLFAVPTDPPQSLVVAVKAVDKAGNEAKVDVNYRLKERRFRHRKVEISSEFLKAKLPEFRQHFPDLPADELAAFLYINRDLRSQNNELIARLTTSATPERLWEGAFSQLPNSAVTANFADQRTYFYQGREIDRQVHGGLDLASTAQCEVPAANKGRVIFADYLGIYGQTVILDHGLGLYSLYGHLSSLSVEKGQEVAQGQRLGQSGSTGLAGGDHLHFSIVVNGVYVDPREWYDPHWIKDNFNTKLEAVAGSG